MYKHALFALSLAALVACATAPTPPPAPAAPAIAPAPAAAPPAPPAAPGKNDYSKAENWLCRPGHQENCTRDLGVTVVGANGDLWREGWRPDPDARIDCFYVYPTVSLDPTPNSDMQPGPEELSAVRSQFARFGSRCRTFAPLYRQVTLTALRSALGGQPMKIDFELGYNDALDAWNYYLAHDNNGRGVVLIGHSQGSRVLSMLISREIEGKPIQAKIISALLLGTNVMVPKGKDVGGTFKSMPLCRSSKQTGCIVTYVTFRASSPPPANSRFGLTQGDNVVACTNPAALGGGRGTLRPYLSPNRLLMAASEQYAWVKPPKPIETPFVSVPGLLMAECASNDKSSYLAVTVNADPNDPRADDIPGDVVVGNNVLKEWGLHLIDVHVAMGNLLDIVTEQAKAYLAKNP